MATITFDSLQALQVFRREAERLRTVASDGDDDTCVAQAKELGELIALITANEGQYANYAATAKWSLTIELDKDEVAEQARNVLWHARLNSTDVIETSEDHIFAGQVVVDPEEAPDPLTAQILITEREGRILATLVFAATPDDFDGLTRDDAVNLLEKLRHAVYR